MPEKLFLVDPTTRKLTGVSSVSLGEIGVKERADLEVWVLNHPEILGEELLVITSEFDRFDRSSRRLDLLALDKHGKLVVIELKLDLSGTVADQQAIRYAALCSTMTMDQVIDAAAAFNGCERAEAVERVATFLGRDELPELDRRPRIILAAGSLDDAAELTSTVLWLRDFSVDITCVELTPFRLPDDRLVLAPRTIIPLPEAKDYLVQVRMKDQAIAAGAAPGPYKALWDAIAECFVAPSGFAVSPSRRSWFLRVSVGHSRVHYEWLLHLTEKRIHVALHIEMDDREASLEILAPVKAHAAQIAQGASYPFVAEAWSERWGRAEFRLPYEDLDNPEAIAPAAAKVMATLIDRTWPLVKPLLEKATSDA